MEEVYIVGGGCVQEACCVLCAVLLFLPNHFSGLPLCFYPCDSAGLALSPKI